VAGLQGIVIVPLRSRHKLIYSSAQSLRR
jgi:hypothetical protein